MAAMQPRFDGFEDMVRSSFGRGAILKVLETEMIQCEPGFVELRQPITPVTLQHHGYAHGGVISTLMDISGGHAAQTLLGADDSVLTIEFKVNMLVSGDGEALRAEGRVIHPGKRVIVARMDLYAIKGGEETLICIGQGTYMRMEGVSGAAMHKARTGD